MDFRKLKAFYGDLHIHTCLSPCADLEMSPRSIMKAARSKDLHFVGICDHNSGENVRAAMKAGEQERIRVIGGMEVTSREEVHILALFDEASQLQALQDLVYQSLPDTDDERIFGDQVVVNEADEVMGFNKKLLLGATEMPLEAVIDCIHRHQGVAVASHIDREGFGIIGQLGFIPDGLGLDAVEAAGPLTGDLFSSAADYPLVLSSDAHFLADIGRRRTCFLLEDLSVSELRKAFRREDGRRIVP